MPKVYKPITGLYGQLHFSRKWACPQKTQCFGLISQYGSRPCFPLLRDQKFWLSSISKGRIGMNVASQDPQPVKPGTALLQWESVRPSQSPICRRLLPSDYGVCWERAGCDLLHQWWHSRRLCRKGKFQHMGHLHRHTDPCWKIEHHKCFDWSPQFAQYLGCCCLWTCSHDWWKRDTLEGKTLVQFFGLPFTTVDAI